MTCGLGICDMKDDCVQIPTTKNEGEKAWGVTTPLVLSPFFEMHHLDIKPMFRCSMHKHDFKHNAFYVLAGLLFIDTEIRIDERREHRALSPGQVYTVAPGVWHQFRTGHESCTALEMYYPERLSLDIIRRNVGGPAEG